MPATGSAFQNLIVFCSIVNVMVRVLLLFGTKHCLFMCYSSFGPVGLTKNKNKNKNKTSLPKRRYLINISFSVSCLLFCAFFSSQIFFHGNLLSLECSIENMHWAHWACSTEPDLLYVHPFIFLYLFVVHLRLLIYSIYHFLQLFCCCSKTFKGLIFSDCKTCLGITAPGHFFCMAPLESHSGNSDSVDWRGDLGASRPYAPLVASTQEPCLATSAACGLSFPGSEPGCR